MLIDDRVLTVCWFEEKELKKVGEEGVRAAADLSQTRQKKVIGSAPTRNLSLLCYHSGTCKLVKSTSPQSLEPWSQQQPRNVQ